MDAAAMLTTTAPATTPIAINNTGLLAGDVVGLDGTGSPLGATAAVKANSGGATALIPELPTIAAMPVIAGSAETIELNLVVSNASRFALGSMIE